MRSFVSPYEPPVIVCLSLAGLVFADALAPFISVRFVAPLLTVTTLALLGLTPWQSGISRRNFSLNRTMALVLAFLLYAMASSVWASKPEISAMHVSIALLIALATLIVSNLMPVVGTRTITMMSLAVWIGVVLGLLYIFVELLSNQLIKSWLYNASGINPGSAKPGIYLHWFLFPSKQKQARSMIPVALFLWPAILAARATLSRPFDRFVAYEVLLLAIAVVLVSPLATAQVSVLASLLIFAIANISLRWTTRLMQFAWLGVVVATIPLAMLPLKLDRQLGSWMPASATHRAVIWDTSARHILRAPILGIGAGMTDSERRMLRNELGRASPGDKSQRHIREPSLGSHAHNVYLQVWLELGIIGALSLTLIGLSLLAQIRALAEQLQPFGLAAFTSIMVVAGLSYGAWQTWYLACFAFCFLFFVIGKLEMEVSHGERLPVQ